MLTSLSPCLNQTLSQVYIQRIQQIERQSPDAFSAARQIARSVLGSRKVGEYQILFGFWVPGLSADPEKNYQLELFLPVEALKLEQLSKGQSVQKKFTRFSTELMASDDYLLGVVDNLPIGTPETDGALYWLNCTQPNGQSMILRDPLAQSLPFGVYAPAEVYDIAGLLQTRNDIDYFRTHYREQYEDGSLRAKDIGITLEIHPETATTEGTLAALTEQFQRIAAKMTQNLQSGQAIDAGLNPAEQNFIGFDTIELTPEVPPVEREQVTHVSGEFFQVNEADSPTITITLKKPDISNWGYDTPIIGTAAINPSILRSGRPHEFLAFVETLHTMPHQPMQLSLDAVLGHADFQGAKLLATPEKEPMLAHNLKYVHSAYFRGANMYGRDLDYANPVVRALLLEMYRRKINFGFDCVRVDGGQDFVKEIDPVTDFRIQDDAFIREMVTQKQEILLPDGDTLIRRLDMNVEDGRPWPNDMNWLYNATYTEHILQHPLPDGDRVKQWGSLIFAHNVHGKFKWFQNKWDRFKDTFKDGQDWITGHSNHDNARYYYRLVSPRPGSHFQTGDAFDDFYNDQLGPDLPSATHTALDNPALSALVLGFLPGSPMFFLNALFRTPWLFFRNTDDQYGVKVVADEGSRFMGWYVNEARYNRADAFLRLKAMGFQQLSQLIGNPLQVPVQAGFLDILFDLHERIKTDPTMVLDLFDDPAEFGRFATVEDLKKQVQTLQNPTDEPSKQWVDSLHAEIGKDPLESARKVAFAKKLIQKTLDYQRQELQNPTTQKLLYLTSLYEQEQHDLLALLLEDAAQKDGYQIARWGENPALLALTPTTLIQNGCISAASMKAFALAFMEDARDLCLVPKYEATLDAKQTRFNLVLRRYRQANPWLTQNPINDLTRDFFNRKILPNGAKNTGAFFSDKGDIVNANTIYYGWRTSPDNRKQVFLLANMEGKPLARLSLSDFLPHAGPWQVVTASPGLGELPSEVDSTFVLTQVTNGQALLLERSL